MHDNLYAQFINSVLRRYDGLTTIVVNYLTEQTYLALNSASHGENVQLEPIFILNFFWKQNLENDKEFMPHVTAQSFSIHIFSRYLK